MKPMHNDVISVYRTPLFGDRALVVVPWPRCHAHAPRAERTHARTHARAYVRTAQARGRQQRAGARRSPRFSEAAGVPDRRQVGLGDGRRGRGAADSCGASGLGRRGEAGVCLWNAGGSRSGGFA